MPTHLLLLWMKTTYSQRTQRARALTGSGRDGAMVNKMQLAVLAASIGDKEQRRRIVYDGK